MVPLQTDMLISGRITVLKWLIINVFISFDNDKLGRVIVNLRKEIKKPLNQAKDPEVKERTYDAFYFIFAFE